MSVSKFQYMPGGQGGGWARPTAGEASSISGRIANTTADTALRCSQGFIGHLLSVAFCVEILRFVRCPGVRITPDGGDHVITVCRTFTPDQGFTDLLQLRNGQVTPGGQTRVALGSAEPSTVTLTQWS